MKSYRHLAVVALSVVVAVTLSACASGGSGGSSSGGGTGSTAVTVSMKNVAFSPSDVTVAVGGTVTFVNDDTVAHDVVGDSWDSGQLAPGASFAQTFPTAGTFAFHCSIHPSMTGSVTVK